MGLLGELAFENSYARLPSALYSRVRPTPLPDPHLVCFNASVAEQVGLDPGEAARPDFARHFGGDLLPAGAEPLALLYSGYQFGVYVPQLGDGRALLLGDVRGPDGRTRELQLKGSGPTPYSRGFDGRAVLRSCVREYLAGEALAGLGIATTRALCVVGSRLPVHRETVETAAVLTRVADSHVRFGSFEVLARRGRDDDLRALADHVIEQHLQEAVGAADAYAQLFENAVLRSAELVARWQAVGFAHGVLNTDNMSVLGLTLDFGPYGFMEAFDPDFVPNHSDVMGRYAYGEQPSVVYWNLCRFAEALGGLVAEDDLKAALARYEPTLWETYGRLMRAKVGLAEAHAGDGELLSSLLDTLAGTSADYTCFFRRLGAWVRGDDGAEERLLGGLDHPEAGLAWLERYARRLAAEPLDAPLRAERMDAVNPLYVLRNYMAQRAIDLAAGEGDDEEIVRLAAALADPYRPHPGLEGYEREAPEWGRRLVVSCSS